MTGSRPEPHTLAGAYAMDALDGQDRARFERHLERCEECTREVAGLHEATARLAGAAAVRPPDALREQLLAETARTRQLPPVTHGASPAPARRAPVVPGQRPARFRGRLRAPRLAVVLAGVAVLAAAGLRALPGSQCYELWLMQPGADRPAGLLPMPKHGMTGPVVATGLRAGDRLGLTVEPSRGSRRPTSPMILVLAL